jgi:hypothetical protein
MQNEVQNCANFVQAHCYYYATTDSTNKITEDSLRRETFVLK